MQIFVATINLIKCWKYVVSKLDFGNWSHTSDCQANRKANDALLAYRRVENTFISFTQHKMNLLGKIITDDLTESQNLLLSSVHIQVQNDVEKILKVYLCVLSIYQLIIPFSSSCYLPFYLFTYLVLHSHHRNHTE